MRRADTPERSLAKVIMASWCAFMLWSGAIACDEEPIARGAALQHAAPQASAALR